MPILKFQLTTAIPPSSGPLMQGVRRQGMGRKPCISALELLVSVGTRTYELLVQRMGL